jgi:recombinational DNA repair protein (RecF pathway)
VAATRPAQPAPDADDVVVCSVVPYGDSDAIVRCFAREAGLVGAFARGARASKRRFPGLTSPALARAQWRRRRGSDLLDLVELDVDARLTALGGDLRAWAFAGYVVEIVDRIAPAGAPQPELFTVVTSTLAALARPSSPARKSRALRAFELQVLANLGVLPDLTGAVDVPDEAVVGYDPVRGHLLARPDGGAVPFSDAARRAALRLLDDVHAEHDDAAHDREDAVDPDLVDDAILREVAVLFAAWLRGQAIQLRSLAVLRSVRATVEL